MVDFERTAAAGIMRVLGTWGPGRGGFDSYRPPAMTSSRSSSPHGGGQGLPELTDMLIAVPDLVLRRMFPSYSNKINRLSRMWSLKHLSAVVWGW